jgi:hypothetical protein
MPTDPFVAPALDDHPRNEPNLAPGVRLPAAQGWVADRPGDLVGGQPKGELLGRPGPNVGYAILLANRMADRLAVGAHEPVADAIAVVSELAMKRAASYGRAPVTPDLEIAATLLGYLGDVDPAFVEWRAHAVHGASHEYPARRAVVDAVSDTALRTPPATSALVADFRAAFRAVLSAETSEAPLPA